MDDFALVANLLYRCSYFHRPVLNSQLSAQSNCNCGSLASLAMTNQKLFIAVHDPTAIQIVRRKFDRDFVSRQYPYEVLPHLAGNVRQYLVLVFELHLEHGIGQRFDHRRHHFNRVFFTHRLLKMSSQLKALLRQNHGPLPRYRHAMFKVRAVAAVYGYGRPLVTQNFHLGTPRVHHRLNRQHHTLSQLRALALLAKVRDLRRFMQLGSDAMPNEVSHHAESVRFHVLLDRRPNVPYRVADLHLLDAFVQRSLGHLEQLLQFRGQFLAHRHRNGSVSVIPVADHAAVDRNDVSRFQRPLFRRDAVHDLFIDRSAQHTWIAVVSLERRRRSKLRNQFLGGLLQIHRGDARRHDRFQVVQNLADHLPAPPHLFDLFRRLADDPVFSRTHNEFGSWIRRLATSIRPGDACQSHRKSAP